MFTKVFPQEFQRNVFFKNIPFLFSNKVQWKKKSYFILKESLRVGFAANRL